MAIPRLAGALIKKLALPQSAGEWALEVGPEVLFAGFAGASLPEGTPLQDRLLMAAEDLTLGLGGSMGGRVLGAGVGGRLANGSVSKMASAMGTGAMAGGMVGGMGVPMLAPRPFAAHLQAKAEQQMAAEQAARDQGIFEQGLMASAQYMADSPRVQGIDGVLAQLYGA